MTKIPEAEQNNWSFPSMDMSDEASNEYDSSTDIFPEIEGDFVKSSADEEDEDDLEAKVPPKKEESKKVTNSELEALKAEYENKIESIKKEYNQKIESVNRLLDELESPLSVFDNEIIDLIQFMIKKITKRIIYKEISADPEIIMNMINDLKQLLKSSADTIAEVYLSEEDFRKLDHQNNNPQLVIAKDDTLDEGDVIIKSNLNEIRAILTERIEQILGNKHDGSS